MFSLCYTIVNIHRFTSCIANGCIFKLESVEEVRQYYVVKEQMFDFNSFQKGLNTGFWTTLVYWIETTKIV